MPESHTRPASLPTLLMHATFACTLVMHPGCLHGVPCAVLQSVSPTSRRGCCHPLPPCPNLLPAPHPLSHAPISPFLPQSSCAELQQRLQAAHDLAAAAQLDREEALRLQDKTATTLADTTKK
jgi:hypothetical protein